VHFRINLFIPLSTIFSSFPFLRYCLALIIGISMYLFFQYPAINFEYILFALILIYIILYLFDNGKYRHFLGYIGLILIVLFGYFNAHNCMKKNDKDNISHFNQYQFYKATINSLVEEKPKSWKAIAKVNLIVKNDSNYFSTGLLLLYFDKVGTVKPTFGQTLLIKGMPNEIEAPKNPDEFDYKKYLAYQGIYHQHYLRDTSYILVADQQYKSFTSLAYRVNFICDSIFTHYFKEKQNLAVVNAMVLGLRDDIDNDLIQAYSAAGAIHVLSVSGLHVGVIYAVLIGLLGIMRKWGRVGKWSFLLIILVILWSYAAITGFSSPVLRSTFMFSIILLAKNNGQLDNSYNTVSISAFCLLVYNPFLLTNVGFLLSYLAVFGMILIQPLLNQIIVIDKKKSKMHWILDRLWKVTTVAVAAQIATLPITIYFFHQFPNYFLLANPLVILLSSFVLIVGLGFLVLSPIFALLGFEIVNQWLAFILKYLVIWLNNTVLFTESARFSVSKYLNFTFFEMVVLYFFIFSIIALFKTKKYKWVKPAICSIALLIGLYIQNIVEVQKQSLICLHAVPMATAVSIIDGNHAKLIAGEEFLTDRKNFGFRINNFWSKRGVNITEMEALPNTSNYLVWQGKSFLFLNDKLKENADPIKPLSVDYLIIRNKNITYSKDIKNNILFKNLIIDGTVSKYYAGKIQKDAEQNGVFAYSLLKSGALIL
jgi:competence protein ComEC